MNNTNTATSSCSKGSSYENDEMSDYNFQMGPITISTLIEQNATHYNMNHKKRGVALIFNHCTYDLPYLKERVGTEEDVKSLTQILKSLGFLVMVHQDLTVAEIRKCIKRVASGNHTDFDCFAMFALTHGNRSILYARDEKYESANLWLPFSAAHSPTLAGKPKLFFIQAFWTQIPYISTETDGQCGGGNIDEGDADYTYVMSSDADFLIVSLTSFQCFAKNKGSWFIQALCEELENNAYNYDILTLLTFVIQKFAIQYDSYLPEHTKNKIPCVITSLTRLVQFNKKNKNLGNKFIKFPGYSKMDDKDALLRQHVGQARHSKCQNLSGEPNQSVRESFGVNWPISKSGRIQPTSSFHFTDYSNQVKIKSSMAHEIS